VRARPFTILLVCLAPMQGYAAQENRIDYDNCRKATVATDKVALCTLALQTTSDRELRQRIFLRRGNSFQELERYHEAIRDYSELIKLDPKVAGYYDNRKTALQSLGRYAEAMQDADMAIQRAPKHAFVYRARGLLEEDMQRYEAAITDFDRAIDIEPTDQGMIVDRARIKAKAGLSEEAIRDLSTVINGDPANMSAFRERGIVYRADRGHFRPKVFHARCSG
jgi:tetratricopeptide (TPR) repeat protein